MFAKVIANFFLTGCTVAVSVLVMIDGWGLHPKSWGWIIGVGFFVQILLWVMREYVNMSGKK